MIESWCHECCWEKYHGLVAQGKLEVRLSKIGILAPLLANYLVLGKLHNPSTALYLNMKLIIVPIGYNDRNLCKLKNSFNKWLSLIINWDVHISFKIWYVHRMRCMVMKIWDELDLGNYMICHSPKNQYVFIVSSRPVEEDGGKSSKIRTDPNMEWFCHQEGGWTALNWVILVTGIMVTSWWEYVGTVWLSRW